MVAGLATPPFFGLRAKLEPALSEGNRDKTMAAPVTAIIGYDTEFWRDSPRTFIRDLTPTFGGNPAASEVAAFRNGTLGAARFLIACRALGLDKGHSAAVDGTGDDGATPALEEPDSPSGRWNHPSTWTHSPRRPSVAAPSQSWARNLGMSFAHHGAKGS